MEVLRRWWRMRYPAYAAGLVAGLAMMLPAFLTYQDQNSRTHQLRTEGVLVQATVGEITITEKLRLRYVFDGVERWGEVHCWQVCHPVGMQLPVWVNPDDPGDFTTEYGSLSKQRSTPEYLIGVVGVWLVTGTLISILARLAGRWRGHRRHRRDQRGQAGTPAPSVRIRIDS